MGGSRTPCYDVESHHVISIQLADSGTRRRKKTPPLPCYWYPKVSKCTAVGSMKGPSQVYKVWGSVKVKGDNASGDLEATEQVEGAEGVEG